MLKIYFIIPFYSNNRLFKEALQSVVKQTHTHWACVVLDDSIDTEQACLAKKTVEQVGDVRVQYRKNEKNIGMAKNINQGLSLGVQSGCDAITVLHADDVLANDYAETMLKNLAAHPEANALFCDTQIIDEGGKSIFSFPDWYKTTLLPSKKEGKITLHGKESIRALIPGNFIFCPTVCFSAKKLGAERFQENLKMVLDFELTLRILLKGGTLIGLYSKPLYYYRRHENNSTNFYNNNLSRFQEERDLYLNLANQLESLGWFDLAQSARQMKIVKLNLFFQIAKSLLRLDLKSAQNFLGFLLKL